MLPGLPNEDQPLQALRSLEAGASEALRIPPCRPQSTHHVHFDGAMSTTDWWAREIRQLVPVLRRLPVEIFDGIIDVSPCISLKTYAYLTAKLTAITDRR